MQLLASVAVTVKVNVPVVVGVPESVPLLESISPGGSVLGGTVKVTVPEPPLAESVWL